MANFYGIYPPASAATAAGTQNVNIVSPIPVPVTSTMTANANGSFANASVVTGSVSTFSPPANSVGFILESDSTNGGSVRWAIVSTPTSSSGMLMEAGRDTGFIPCAAAVKVISVTGTNVVGIQWVMSS